RARHRGRIGGRGLAVLRADLRHGAARDPGRRPGPRRRQAGARFAAAAQSGRRLPAVQHDRQRSRVGLQRHGGSGRSGSAAGTGLPGGARRLDRASAGARDPRIQEETAMTRSCALRVAGFVMVLAAAAATGCDRREPQASRPTPSEVLAEATGYYCGMLLVDHEGPKGQIHLASRSEPVWFSSVRDTIAFVRLPEEPRDITAIYV